MRLRPRCLFVAVILTSRSLTAQAARPIGASGGTDRAVIRGVVVDTLERLVPGVRVYLLIDSIVPAFNGVGRAQFKWPAASRESDQRGRFEFEVLNSRPYTLRTFGARVEAEMDTVGTPANDSVRIRLVLNRAITPGSAGATRSRRLAQLTRAEVTWAARGVTRYRLTAELDCLCSEAKDGRATLEFRGDSLLGYVDRDGRVGAKPVLQWWPSFSVPSLFAAAESEIRNPTHVVFSIVYDPTYGFPKLISTDTNPRLPDHWLRYWATDFRVIRR